MSHETMYRLLGIGEIKQPGDQFIPSTSLDMLPAAEIGEPVKGTDEGFFFRPLPRVAQMASKLKFSEWAKRSENHIVDTAAGDHVEELPEISKWLLDAAIERYVRCLVLGGHLPPDNAKQLRKAANNMLSAISLCRGAKGDSLGQIIEAAEDELHAALSAYEKGGCNER